MNSRTRINDRFFIGGPLSVRGFNYLGLGPKDGSKYNKLTSLK